MPDGGKGDGLGEGSLQLQLTRRKVHFSRAELLRCMTHGISLRIFVLVVSPFFTFTSNCVRLRPLVETVVAVQVVQAFFLL